MVCTRRKNYNSPNITITLTRKNRTRTRSEERSTRSTRSSKKRCIRKVQSSTPNKIINTKYLLRQRNRTKQEANYIYRTIIIEKMTDFEKLKSAMDYRYVFFIVKSSNDFVMVGRTETSSLKRKFCNMLNNSNDVVNTTDARLYLVLSNDEMFIREMNIATFSSVGKLSCLTPISWKAYSDTFDELITSRDKWIRTQFN